MKYMTKHFVERVLQRYGFHVTEDDAHKIIRRILMGYGKLCSFGARGCKRYRVDCKGKHLVVVYHPCDNVLITAYPNAHSGCSVSMRHAFARALGLKERADAATAVHWSRMSVIRNSLVSNRCD